MNPIVRQLADAAYCPRDRFMILIGGTVDILVTDLRRMTVGDARAHLTQQWDAPTLDAFNNWITSRDIGGQNPDDPAFVSLTRDKGRPISRNRYFKATQMAAQRAGLPHISHLGLQSLAGVDIPTRRKCLSRPQNP